MASRTSTYAMIVNVIAAKQQAKIKKRGAARVIFVTPSVTPFVALFVALLAGLLTLTTVGALPASAETTVEVTTPADRRYHRGEPTPLIITISADGAVKGSLSISFDGITYASQPFEVPGGSAKEIIVITDTSPWQPAGSVNVTIDDKTTTTRFTLIDGGEELIGVLPDLATGQMADTADLSVDLGQARLYPVDERLYELGPSGLNLFDYIAASSSDLDALAPGQLESLSAWVAAGGRLVVDAAAATALPGRFGEAQQVSAQQASGQQVSGRSSAERLDLGFGSVQFSNGQIDDAGFNGIFAPSPAHSTDDTPFGGGWFFPPTLTLASDAGVRIPAIGSLVIMLLVYAVLIGPVLWWLLRRSNREPVLWLAIPLAATLATAGVWLFGRELRDNVTAAHGTLIVDTATSQTVISNVLVSSPNGGWAGVDLPEGWSQSDPGGNNEEFGFEPGFGSSRDQQVAVRGAELGAELAPGGIAVVGAQHTAKGADAWRADLRYEEGEIVGTITNLTEFELEKVTVSSGLGLQTFNSIAPGETKEVSFGSLGGLAFQGDRLLEQLGREDPFNPAAGNGAVNPSIMMKWLTDHPELRSPRFSVVAGWTREPDGPLRTANGALVQNGRTGFVSVTEPDSRGAEISSATNVVSYLRGFDGTNLIDPSNGFNEFPMTISVTPLPGTDTSSPLVLDVPGVIAALDVWDGTQWQPAGMNSVDPNGSVIFPVDEAAMGDGSIYMRLQMGENFWNLADPLPQLRTLREDDDLRLLGDPETEASQ